MRLRCLVEQRHPTLARLFTAVHACWSLTLHWLVYLLLYMHVGLSPYTGSFISAVHACWSLTLDWLIYLLLYIMLVLRIQKHILAIPFPSTS